MTHESKKHDFNFQNEEELQSLFDQTAYTATEDQVHRTARFTASLEKKKAHKFSKLFKMTLSFPIAAAFLFGLGYFLTQNIHTENSLIENSKPQMLQEMKAPSEALEEDLTVEEELALAMFEMGFVQDSDDYFDFDTSDDFFENDF